jgi:transglutaminase-like putative cysteine protease
MLFEISHRTRYSYSQPVYLEPFTLRLRPRSDAIQTLRGYDMVISPQPGGSGHCMEPGGNVAETIWFDGLHRSLDIEIRARVETHHGDPFNFLVTQPRALELPCRYEPHTAFILAPYLACGSRSPLVEQFAREIMQEARHETLPFLSLLAQQIPVRLEYMLREHGEPWSPEETLANGKGSCRDFAVLFIEVCRVAGIAARFVSGYCVGDAASGSHMHAWSEVYLPGAGWRGFDPSRGLTVSDEHIVVAAGQCPQDAAPTFGSFRGEAESAMEVHISLAAVA